MYISYFLSVRGTHIGLKKDDEEGRNTDDGEFFYQDEKDKDEDEDEDLDQESDEEEVVIPFHKKDFWKTSWSMTSIGFIIEHCPFLKYFLLLR